MQGRNKITMKVKCMILIPPCCRTFENATTRLKDAATRLSYKNSCFNALTSHEKRFEMKFQT